MQGVLASKLKGYIPLGIPEGYNVLFNKDGSADITCTQIAKDDIIEETFTKEPIID